MRERVLSALLIIFGKQGTDQQGQTNATCWTRCTSSSVGALLTLFAGLHDPSLPPVSMADLHPLIAALRSGKIIMPTKLFAPNINHFAVVRLNPIVMVQDLDDPEALAEARAMSTKKYPVFLVNVSA